MATSFKMLPFQFVDKRGSELKNSEHLLKFPMNTYLSPSHKWESEVNGSLHFTNQMVRCTS